MREYRFTLEELIEALKEIEKENSKLHINTDQAFKYVSKITGLEYDYIYDLSRPYKRS